MRKIDDAVEIKLAMGVEFPVSAAEIHTLSVTVLQDSLAVEMDDMKMTVLTEDIFETFQTGIVSCEGINRFYELSIDGEQA